MIGRELKLIVSFIALLVTPALASTSTSSVKPLYLRDLPIAEYRSGTIEASGRNVRYSVSYETSSSGITEELLDAYSVSYVQDTIANTTKLMMRFFKSNGIYGGDCRSDYNINIYIISQREMLSSQRFAPFFRQNGIQPVSVYGLYDVTPNIRANSAVIISDFGREQNVRSISHELAHYWWDRACIANAYSGTSEQFALDFEEYYWRTVK